MSPILSELYSENVTKPVVWRFGEFKFGGQVNGRGKFADDLVLLAEEETVLEGAIGRLTGTGRCGGMEMDVGNILQ